MATSTPWGPSQQVDHVARGIVWYSTASHGGYHLSSRRIAEMPEEYRNHNPWAGPGWYEEDCDWAFVVLSFPEIFKGYYGAEKFERVAEEARKTIEWLYSKQRKKR